MQEEKKVRESFTLKEEANPYDMPSTYSDSSKRIAVIEFCNTEFVECKYQLSNKIYNYKDWIFIGKVSERIQELKKELNDKYTEEEIKRIEIRLDDANVSNIILYNLATGTNWHKPKRKYSLTEIKRIAFELEKATLVEKKTMYVTYLNNQWEGD